MPGNIFIVTIKIDRKLLILITAALIFTLMAVIPPSVRKTLLVFNDNSTAYNAVVVDPGHGGIDGGATDRAGLLEKDINLDVSLRIANILKNKHVKALLTRDKDISLDSKSSLKASRHRRDLNARKNIINRTRADIFISIHVDSDPGHPQTRGMIVFYYPESREGQKLAQFIKHSIDIMIYERYLRDASLRTRIRVNDYYILRETRIPGVLIELGFITNPEDKKLLLDINFREKIAEAISCGLVEYLNSIQ